MSWSPYPPDSEPDDDYDRYDDYPSDDDSPLPDDDSPLPDDEFTMYADDEPDDDPAADHPAASRSLTSDPLFGLLLAGAIAIGLLPLVGNNDADMRYSLTWGTLALFGVLAWLFGSSPRIGQEAPEDVAWGAVFGLILGAPVLLFGGGALKDIVNLLFQNAQAGTILAFVVFVMPLAETLFFRGLLQEVRRWPVVALMCSAWQMVLFFPLINQGPYPLVVGVIVLMANLLYGYVRLRNGLAAAWVAQITVNLMVFFIPLAF
ncbi:MAG: type II CAAX prenyl endopeptidase Rce1 family protein [Phototrophicaceae bacterium]